MLKFDAGSPPLALANTARPVSVEPRRDGGKTGTAPSENAFGGVLNRKREPNNANAAGVETSPPVAPASAITPQSTRPEPTESAAPTQGVGQAQDSSAPSAKPAQQGADSTQATSGLSTGVAEASSTPEDRSGSSETRQSAPARSDAGASRISFDPPSQASSDFTQLGVNVRIGQAATNQSGGEVPAPQMPSGAQPPATEAPADTRQGNARESAATTEAPKQAAAPAPQSAAKGVASSAPVIVEQPTSPPVEGAPKSQRGEATQPQGEQKSPGAVGVKVQAPTQPVEADEQSTTAIRPDSQPKHEPRTRAIPPETAEAEPRNDSGRTERADENGRAAHAARAEKSPFVLAEEPVVFGRVRETDEAASNPRRSLQSATGVGAMNDARRASQAQRPEAETSDRHAEGRDQASRAAQAVGIKGESGGRAEAAPVLAGDLGLTGPVAPGSTLGAAAKPKAQGPQAEAHIVAQSVSRGLAAAVNQKGGEVTLRLAPHSLGLVRIHMTLNQGVVSVRLEATGQAAHGLLAENIAMLRGTLESKGLVVDRLSVQYTPSASASAAVGAHASSSGHSGQGSGTATQSDGSEDPNGWQDAAGDPSRGRRDQEQGEGESQGGTESWRSDSVDERLDPWGPHSKFGSKLRLRLETTA